MTTVVIAASHQDARTTLGLTSTQLRNDPIITPRSMYGARGWTADALTITAAAVDHPKMRDMLDEALICCLHRLEENR